MSLIHEPIEGDLGIITRLEKKYADRDWFYDVPADSGLSKILNSKLSFTITICG